MVNIKHSEDLISVTFEEDIVLEENMFFSMANVRICKGTFIGKGTTIRANVVINPNVHIGRNCQIGNNAFIREYVVIEDNVKIGFSTAIEPHAFIGTGTSTQGFCMISEYSSIGKNVFLGPYFNNPADNTIGKPEGEYIANPAVIEDDCRFGSSVKITPGNTIRKGTIIGAGSLVTKDTEPNSLYYGTPARRIK